MRYAIEHSLFIQLCSKGLKCLTHYNVMNPLFKNLLRQSTSLLKAFGEKLQSHWTCPSRTPYRLGEMFQSGWEASPQSHKHFYSYTTTTCARACMDVSSFFLRFLPFKLNFLNSFTWWNGNRAPPGMTDPQNHVQCNRKSSFTKSTLKLVKRNS